MKEFYKLYLSRFIYGVGVMSTFTFTLYFLSHGLTQAQISILYSVFFLATAAFEIPTGGFADTYGHRTSYALGFIIEAFYYLIFFLFPTFWGIMVGMVVAALGVSFQSGANDSLTYEMLKKVGKSEDFVKINSRISTFGDVAVILAAPLGLYIYKYYPSLPYLISFVLVLIAGLITSLVRFEFTRPVTTNVKLYIQQLKTGVSLTAKNPRLIVLALMTIITLVSSYVMTENISLPLQVDLSIDVGAIGFTQSLISIGFIVVGLTGYRIIRKIGGVHSLAISIIFQFTVLLILSRIHTFWGAGFIVLFMLLHSFRCQVLGDLRQQELTSAQRSTMASTGNMITALAAAAIMPLWGLTIDKVGIRSTLVWLSLFIMVIGLVGTAVYSKLKTENRV